MRGFLDELHCSTETGESCDDEGAICLTSSFCSSDIRKKTTYHRRVRQEHLVRVSQKTFGSSGSELSDGERHPVSAERPQMEFNTETTVTSSIPLNHP